MEFPFITHENGDLGLELLVFGLKLLDFGLFRLDFGLKVRKVLKLLLEFVDLVLE